MGREPGRKPPRGDRSDECLFIALTRGDADALAEVFERHGAAVHAVACRLCGPAQAKQVTAAVFVDLSRRPEEFSPTRGSLLPRLVSDGHRRAVDLVRAGAVPRRALEAAMPVQELEASLLAAWPADAGPSLLAGGSDTGRRAIILSYFGGYDYREVAALLNRPSEDVKGDIRASLRRMRPGTPPHQEDRAAG